MSMATNFAVSPEGQANSKTLVPRYSVTADADLTEFSVTTVGFDAKLNTQQILESVFREKPADRLLYAAARALQHQAKITESELDWAERLSHGFFTDLKE